MIGIGQDLRVVLATQPVDFRYGINKLAALVAQTLVEDPFAGDVFVFRSKRSDRLKLIHFDGTGIVLVTKWLESGQFAWPPIRAGAVRISGSQMALLLAGLDWTRLVQRPVKRPTLAA
jgi:transposase